MKDINYKILLEKYMNYVNDCEGVDFINLGGSCISLDNSFDLEEITELKRISDSIV